MVYELGVSKSNHMAKRRGLGLSYFKEFCDFPTIHGTINIKKNKITFSNCGSNVKLITLIQ
jgi:hypothetical protein